MPRYLALSAALMIAPTGALAEDVVIRDGFVMTMGPAGDLAQGDILIRDGVIVEIGADLTAPAGARTIDAKDRIVLPGFVNAHDHLWITPLRGLYGNTRETAFTPVTARFAGRYAPEDTYAAVLAGSLEGLEAGYTTQADFFDNVRGPEHADAALRALEASGARARLYYGAESKTTPKSVDLDDVARLADSLGGHPRLQVGLAWRLPAQLDDAQAWAIKDREWDFASRRHLPIQVHVSNVDPERAAAMFQTLIDRHRLSSTLSIVHATDASSLAVEAADRSGAGLVITPQSEHRVGYGPTRLSTFAAAEKLGLGVDGPALSGTADAFAAMRLLAFTETGAAHDETAASPRTLLRIATLGGAQALGLQDRIGSIEPGKAADLLIVSLQSLSLAGARPEDGADPAVLLVYSARPTDIETVLVGGVVVKQDGALVDQDLAEVRRGVRETVRRLTRE